MRRSVMNANVVVSQRGQERSFVNAKQSNRMNCDHLSVFRGSW